jgi:hypothetical protein
MRTRFPAPELRVRLLADPCLWCWEIVDRRRADAPVHSSWTTEWMAYESPEEALTAGRRHLAALMLAGAEGATRARARQKGETAA